MELDTTTRDILLLDIYGGLLTERQRSLLTLHLEDDLSLGEIAELEGISRQGVRDQVNQYMRTVMGEEPLDPTLEILEDENSW